MTKAETIYTKYERFEEQLAHCYFLLHQRFINEPQLAQFWADAAMDELQHLSMLRFCREKGAMTPIALDTKTTEGIEDLLDTVKGLVTDPEVTVEEAFYASLLMETSELEDIYDRLISRLELQHPYLYHGIRASLRSHHQAFSEGAKQFCKDPGFMEAFKNLERRPS